jgi:hypothetical protein
MAVSPLWFGRYKEDNKPAMHVQFLMNNMLYLIDEQPHYVGRPQGQTPLIFLGGLRYHKPRNGESAVT